MWFWNQLFHFFIQVIFKRVFCITFFSLKKWVAGTDLTRYERCHCISFCIGTNIWSLFNNKWDNIRFEENMRPLKHIERGTAIRCTYITNSVDSGLISTCINDERHWLICMHYLVHHYKHSTDNITEEFLQY